MLLKTIEEIKNGIFQGDVEKMLSQVKIILLDGPLKGIMLSE